MATTPWVRPEVYPLMAALAFVVGIGVFSLSRHLLTNPEVRINKTNRATAVLENQDEGERYAEHGLRKFVRQRPPQIMPAVNDFFTKEK